MTTNMDRLSDGYQPDFDIDMAIGRQGELWVNEIVDNWYTDSVEVKTDERSSQTKNLFFEYECLRRGAYRPSGIATTKASYWAQVIGGRNLIMVVPVSGLRELLYEVKAIRSPGCIKPGGGSGSHPTNGIVVSVTDFVKWFNTTPGTEPVLGR